MIAKHADKSPAEKSSHCPQCLLAVYLKQLATVEKANADIVANSAAGAIIPLPEKPANAAKTGHVFGCDKSYQKRHGIKSRANRRPSSAVGNAAATHQSVLTRLVSHPVGRVQSTEQLQRAPASLVSTTQRPARSELEERVVGAVRTVCPCSAEAQGPLR